MKLGSNGVSRRRQKLRKFVVFGELKGQTDDSFNDVKDVSTPFFSVVILLKFISFEI